MTLTPTPEQQEIIEAVRTSSNSLLINALAGAAKTSTLVMAAHKLPLVPTACVAFNKKIADEMSKRLPGHISCSTLNSLGHRVWAQTRNKRFKVDSGKGYSILSDILQKAKPDDRKALGESFAAILRAARLAKSLGYIPRSMRTLGKTLVSESELESALLPVLDLDPDEFFFHTLDRILEISIQQSYESVVDFDDQIYMSTLFGGSYPKFPVLMVDEAQDLSPLNHRTLELMFKERIIAVGDPFQSIYGFRGAHHSSMEVLQETFHMKPLSLSISFRCPIEVVKRARVRAPNMQWPEWAEEGHVEKLFSWNASSIPDGAAIICRNNAPLFSCALALLRARRGVKLVGSEIGKSLVSTLEKLGPGKLFQAEVLTLIDQWEKDELKRAKEGRKASIHDRADCLRVFAQAGETLIDAISYAKTLFTADGPIQLMTGHKSKGLEFDTVYYLNSFLIPSKFAKASAENGDDSQLTQELNLNYVIITRAKKELYFVSLEDFQP